MTAPLAARPTAEQVRQAAALKLAQLSFTDFLAFCRIQSDDPMTPGEITFQPWDYQLERAKAWADNESEVILKARQLGFSWLLAAYILWRAMMWNWAIGYYSRGEPEAIAELDSRILYIWQRLPKWMQGGQYKRRDTHVIFPGGGSIRVFPSTEDAGVGYTFQLIVADECAFHRYGAKNYAAYRPTLSAGGQYIAASTADPSLGPSGFFYDLWSATAAGDNPYRPVFVPWHARPGRDEAWLARERAAFTGMPEEFDAYYPASESDAFVGKAGLVYPQFKREQHVRDGDPVPWEECVARYAGYDLGGGDPTAITFLGVYRGSDGVKRVHQYGEAYWKQGAPPLESLAAAFFVWHNRARFTHIERDPASTTDTVAKSLQALGLPVGLKPASRRVEDRLAIQALYLERGWLTFNAECKESIHEFAGYRWREKTDPNSRDRYRTSTPVGHHADAMDARGQALVRIYSEEMMAASAKPASVLWT